MGKKHDGHFFLVETCPIEKFWDCILDCCEPMGELNTKHRLYKYELLLGGEVLITRSQMHNGYIVFAEDERMHLFREEMLDFLASPEADEA